MNTTTERVSTVNKSEFTKRATGIFNDLHTVHDHISKLMSDVDDEKTDNSSYEWQILWQTMRLVGVASDTLYDTGLLISKPRPSAFPTDDEQSWLDKQEHDENGPSYGTD